jgi:predicted DCC family thiol-disulfide oxidoreductase YuxK
VILVYDGACRLCRVCAALVLRADRRRRVEAITLEQGAARGLSSGIDPERWRASWHVIDDAGALRSGGAAVGPLLRVLGLGPAAVLVERAPRATDRAYRGLADRRGRLSRWLPAGAARWADRTIAARARPAGTAPAPSPAAGAGRRG